MSGFPLGARSGTLLVWATLAAVASTPAPVLAATTQATIAVSASIVPTCTISAAALDFGVYVGVQKDASATMTVVCTNTTTYTIGINAGTHSGGNYNWNLAGPSASLLTYRLYRDAGRTNYWGGTSGLDTNGGTGNGNLQSFTMYGRELGGQFVRPGAYSDTVNLTLYY